MSFADFKLIGINRFPTSLYMWGDNTNGLLGDNRTPSYFSWSKISSGGLHTVAIRSDGTLFVWGRNTEFQLGDTTTVHRSSPVQIGTSSWSQVSAGTSHTIAIRGDSTLWTWGANRYGQLGLGDTANRSSPVQVGTSSWSVISAGGNHSLGIKIDNSVFAWGYNGSGQLGDLSIQSKNSPVQVGTTALTDANAYSLSFDGTGDFLTAVGSGALVRSSGSFTIEGWYYPTSSAASFRAVYSSGTGYATAGRLYQGSSLGTATTLTFYWGSSAATSVTGSIGWTLNTWNHFAVTWDGTTTKVYINGQQSISSTSPTYSGTVDLSIGENTYSPFGYISNFRVANSIVYASAFTPSTTPLTAISGTILLTAQNTTIIDNSTNAFTITNNSGISYSVNTPFSSSIPLGGFIATLVSAGKSHSTAITTSNQLYAWGDNTYGELGDSTTINRSSPVQIGNSSYSQVSAGGTHTVGIESDGSLMAWGYNNYGQLGLNTPYSGTYYTQVSEGLTHTLAIRNDGALFVWGRNQLGQLGLGDTISRSSPIQLGTSSWSYVDAGNSHSVAVRSDGTLFTWGANDYGQLGNNLNVTTIANNIAWSKIVMSSSGTHSLAIKNDGTLWGWGLNTSGQLGDGTATNKSSPVQVGALNTWIDVAAGSVHSLGITNDNVLYTWGTNTFGQLGDNTAAAKSSPIVVGFNYKKVFAGFQNSIAIDNNNYTYIWGDNTNGLILGGVVGTHRSSISLLNNDTNWSSFAVDQHILGIKTNGSLWSWGLGTTGQLGLNDLLSRSSPVQVGTSSWSQVSAGLSYSMGITTDNSLYAWGLNSSGQLGLSDTVNRSAPATVGVAGGLSDANAYSTLFNGSNSTFLTIPSGAVTTGSTSPIFTVECWVYLNGVGGAILIRPLATNAPYFGLGFNAGTTQLALIGNSGATNGSILSTKKWHHIALTRSATTYNCYLNGVLDITTAVTIMADSSYVIGYGFDGGTISYPLDGYISNFRISNKVVYTGNFTVPTNPLELTQSAGTNITSLTTGEVKFLSLNTGTSNPTDASTNSYTITVSGTITSSQLTPFTTAIVTGSTIATSVITGTAHTLMLDTIGNLYTWGLGTTGQLGDTTVLSRSSPVQVGTDIYNYIFAGTSHSTAIRSTDSALFTWGLGTSGQLGDITALSKSSPVQIGTTLANQSSPVQIGNSSYSQVSAGDGHTLGLGRDGILYGWGKNDQGQIGGQLNTLGIGWSKVVIGPTHSLGIRFDGTLYAWGVNATGQLGDRTTVAKSSPVVIDSANNWKDIAVGQGTLYYSMAIRNDGKLYAWGNNQGGQLGWISWRQLSVGSGHSLLLRSDGALYTMGTNTAGQLGDATTVNKSSPVLIGTSSWNFVNAGVSASAAIDSVGRLFTWGFNNVGQLGLANTTSRSSPVQVSTGSWSQVASEDYMLAITSQGSIWSWGNNNVGQLGLGTTVNSKVPKLLDGTTTSYSIGFDGVNDYLTIPANTAFVFGTGNFTIECWFYITQGPNGTIFDSRSVSPSITPLLYFSSSILKYKVDVTDQITSTTTLLSGVWYHVALVRSSGSSKMYLNGVQTGSTYADTNNFTLNNTIYISRGFDSSNYLTGGYISNLRVVKGQALYTAKFTPTTTPLTTTSQGISSGTVSLLTAQNATIIDNSGNGFTITATGTPTVTQYNPFSVISSTSSTSWTKVAAGTHSLAIRSDSTLYAWGQNNFGQLGDSTTINKSSPIQIGTSSWTLISTSMTGHSLGIEVDGTLYAWGRNTYGELGLNNEFINVSSPTQIGTNSYTSVSAGNNASLAISLNGINNVLYGWGLNSVNQLNNISAFSWRSTQSNAGIQAGIGSTVGKLYLWGDNTYGQLGDNTLAARSSPTQLGGFYGAATYKEIVTTPLNTAILTSDNSLLMMGDNTYGQLGQGDTINRSSPVQVGASGAWSAVVISGTGHVLAINMNSVLLAWGNNTYNELGQSDLVVANRSSPVIIGTDANWTKISAGNNYSLAINSIGRLFSWGRNDWGQLGTSIPLSYTNIGAGIASRNDGKLYTWGTNTPYGQVGDGTTINRSAPTQISGVTLASISWTSVSGSLNNRASIRINSTLWAWGDNTYGQLGQVDTIPRSNPVQIGISSWTQVHVNSDNIFAIRSDGKLFSWGNNNVGQLGTGDTINYSSPVQIGSDSWNQIIASTTGHALGLKADGTLWAWGNNQYNELGQNQRIQSTYSSPIQVGTSSWTKISAGNNNSFAIRTDGSLWGWGRNDFGQIGTNVVTPLSWTSVAGGDSYSVAIRSDGKLFSWGRNDKGQLGLGHTVSKSAPTQIAVSTNYNLYSTFFNGTSDYLSIPNNAAFNFGSDNFTVEAWVYIIARNSSGSCFAGNWALSGRGWIWLCTSTTLSFVYSTNGVNEISAPAATYTVALNTWTHLAAVRNENTITMYANGVSVGTASVTGVTINSATQPLYIGANKQDVDNLITNYHMNGYISNLRMVKGTAVYTGNFVVPTTPLTNITNTSLLTCQNDRFIDNSNNNFTLTPAGTGITTTTLTPFQTTTYNYSWTQVSATLSHTVAIRNDGTLWSWGANNGGQLSQGDTVNRSAPVQVGSSSWTNVFAGRNATYAIRTDSALFSVGDNTFGQLGQNDTTIRSSLVQVGTSSWTSISASLTGHVLGILSTGALYAWGYNQYNELGLNVRVPTTTSSPTQIGSSSWTKVSAGNNFTLGILSTGALYGWGRNDFGQAGLNTGTILPPLSWSQVAGGDSYSVAIRNDGKLYSWGRNDKGQLGLGTTLNVSVPTQVGGNAYPTSYSWTQVSATLSHVLAIRTDGSLWSWGANNSGQLGQSDTANRSAPVQIGTSSWTKVSAGSDASFAIRTDGALFGWGDNTNGILGQNDIVSRSSILQIGTSSWTNISGTQHILATTNLGAMFAWGLNNAGQLGTTNINATGDVQSRSSPVQIGSPNSWNLVAAGNSFSMATGSTGLLYTWGLGTSGQLGGTGGGTTTASNNTSRSSPSQVGASSWSVIASGTSWAAGISAVRLYLWGGSANYEAGTSATLLRSSPVQLGALSWTAIGGTTNPIGIQAVTGNLFAWGTQTAGQVGIGDTALRSSPVQIASLTGLVFDTQSSPTQIGTNSWTQVQAGTSWSAAILSTGALFTWGAGVNGELGSTATTSRSSPVQVGLLTTWSRLVGTTHVLSTTTSGALWTWGLNNIGQVGDNTTVSKSSPVQIVSLTGQVFDNVSSPTQIGTSSWTQVAAGDLFTNALRAVDGGLFTWGYGVNGRLGSGATASRSSPVQVGTSSWIAVSTGGTENTVALTKDYTLFSWGRNNVGQVGDATTVDKSAPSAVGAALNLNLMTGVIKTVTQVGASSWTQISAGDFHAYAIITSGGLFAWGKNDQGQLGLSIAITTHRSSPVQVGAATYNVISAGNSFGAAITTLGSLQTTGLNNQGQQGAATTVNRSAFTAVGTSSWTQVSAGASSVIGTTLSNITFVWGNNNAGQLGLGDTAGRSSPVQLGSSLATGMYQTVYPSPVIVTTYSNASWSQVNVGDSFAVGLDNAGRLFAWGQNNTGQLGDGTTINTTPTKSSPSQIATTASSFTFINTSSPVQVSAGTSWNAIASGGTHTVAIKSDGTLWAWGINTFGQVGSGSTIAQYIPKQVDILNSFVSVAAGTDFSIAINNDKTLWKWGYNSSTDIASPHRSNALQLGTDSWNFISAGGNTAVAINSLGKLYGWGKVTTDDGFAFNLAVNPITWAVGSSYTSVNAGDSFIHALDSNYGLWGYGLNNIGQLGDNTTVTRSSPVQIGSLYSWSIVGGGIGTTPIHAGALYLTGLNTSGQLGLGDTAYRSSPVQLPATNQPLFNFPVRIGISRWSQISAGDSHSMAIRDDSTLWGWGRNTSGQVGDTSLLSRSSPVQVGTSSWIAVSAGGNHTGAVRLDNTLYTWGLNTRGQLGLGDTVIRSSPVQVGTGYWNNVIAGSSHTVGLAENNTLYVWGDDNFGQ